MAGLSLVIGTRDLKQESLVGDIEVSTVWPGGLDQVTWTPATPPMRRLTGGEPAQLYFGPVLIGSGNVLEPDASQDELAITGLWKQAYNYPAFDASFLPTKTPGIAIDRAHDLGMAFTRTYTFSPSAVDIDTTEGPVQVGNLLDAWSEQSAIRWGIDQYGQFKPQADSVAPMYQIVELEGGLGYALDNYACTLYGRYNNGTTYVTTNPVTDAVAKELHGTVAATVDLTPRGTLTEAKAEAILTNLLALGRSQPQWVSSIELSYGEIFTMEGSKVALETVQAGCVIRVPGGYELAQRLNGALFVDVLIGRTDLSNGLLTLSPFQAATSTYADLVTKLLEKK